jgi:hypothetical protein
LPFLLLTLPYFQFGTKKVAARPPELLRFLMRRVLFAVRAVFVEFYPVGIVFLILERIVISVFTFRASQRDFISRSFCSHGTYLPISKN